jgi:PIN domain nuclease of toxin-antitoxin system
VASLGLPRLAETAGHWKMPSRLTVRFLDQTPAHAVTALAEPLAHGDKFDELLLVRAEVEGLRLLTRDRLLAGHLVIQSLAR